MSPWLMTSTALRWSFQVFLLTTVTGFLFREIGVIDPQTDVYLPVGGELNLNCTLTGYHTPLNASYLYFTWKPEDQISHQVIPKENLRVLGPRKIGLTLHNVQLSDSGWYFCTLDESSVEGRTNSTSINQISVTVSEPPQPITNITCISDNYEDMMCDWCDQVQPGVRYELHWRIGSTSSFNKCIETMRQQSNCKCYFPGPRYHGSISAADHFHLGLTYKMVVLSLCPPTICHGTNVSSHQFLINTLAIVKPRPPNQLFVNVIDSTTLSVSWQPPPGLENSLIYPLVYAISYIPKGNPDFMKREVVFNETSLNLINLHPYTEYNISVMAKPSMDGGYYSEKTSSLVRTGESEPSAPPQFVAGSFRINEQTNSKRKVIIFFGEIPKYEVNGVLTHFTIKYRALEDGAADELTVFSHKNKYTKELLLDSQSTYRVSVAGHTIGDGVSSSIYIPRSQNVQAPKDIEGIVGENGTFVRFRVILSDGITVDNYTLVYCHGQMINGISEERDCKNGSIPMARIYPGNSEQLLFDGHQADFVYGIAVNYNRNTTSGLPPTWLCLYDYNGEPSPPIVSYPQEQDEGSLTMQWERPRCSQEVRGRVSHYELNVYFEQELVHNTSIEAGFNEMLFYTIPNLKPYTKYNIVMTACTLAKCGLAYNGSQLSPESAPGGPPMNIKANYYSDDMTLTWQPPTLLNGIITHYHIEITNVSSPEKVYKKVDTKDNNTIIVIPDLPGYTNYSVQVQAVNSAGNSILSEPVMVLGPVKAPGHVKLKAKLVDRSTIHVNISPPQPPNGPHPEFLLITSHSNFKRNYTINKEQYNLKLDCSKYNGLVNLTVLARNTLKNGTILEGPATEVVSLMACSKKSGTLYFGIVAGVAGLAVVIIVLLIICLRKQNDHKPGSTKAIMPPEVHEVENETDPYITIHTDSQMSEYSKSSKNNMQLDGDMDHDSGVSNPQNSYRSQEGSLDYDEGDSNQLMVSSEDEQNSSDVSVTLVGCQLSNQSVESGKMIDTYTKAAGAKPAAYHEINNSEPLQSASNETDSELKYMVGDGGKSASSIEISANASTGESESIVIPTKPGGIPDYQHGNAREEAFKFEVPEDLAQNSSALTESTNGCDQFSTSSSHREDEVNKSASECSDCDDFVIHLQTDHEATPC